MRSPEDIIILQPELQSTQQKILLHSVTVFVWLVWFYLWLPAFSLVAWLFGFHLFYHHMIELGGYLGFLQLFVNYLVVILVMGGSLLLWATYNIKRFGGLDRRSGRPLVTTEQMAEKLKIEPSQLSHLHSAQLIEVNDDVLKVASY